MIRLERQHTAAGVPAGFRGQGRVDKERALLDLFRLGKPPSSAVWKAAKPHLKSESGGKCAYCESATDVVAHGDVEHFRPKSKYWWLAYCFENYTFACQICNQVYKGDDFPTAATPLAPPVIPEPFDAAALAGTLTPDPLDAVAIDDFRRRAALEQAHLPDPYVVDPEPLFKWVAFPVLREVEIRARNGSDVSRRAFAAAVEFLGLNRDELKRRRYLVYEGAAALVQVLRTPNLPPAALTPAEDQLRRMTGADSEYAGMIRYFVTEEWRIDL